MPARLKSVSWRHVVAALALGFFVAPLTLRAAGMTARPFENRPMATFPKLSQGWDAVDQGRRFLVDRLPLREQAVRADAWISTDVFDTDPAAGRAGARGPVGVPAKPPATAAATPAPAGDKAVAGKAGWLFLEGEFVRACVPFIAWPKAMLRWERLAAVIRRSGRRVVLAFPPDKSAIHPEYLPDSFAQRACLAPGHDAAWAAIEGATDPAVLGLRRAMLAAKRPGTRGPYYRKDTHWNTMGGTIAVRELLERLGGAGGGVRMRDDEIVTGVDEYGGDLATLSGAPTTDTAPRWTIRRRAGAAKLPGRTLFVYDSFGTAMQDALVGYLSDPELLPWYNTPPEAIIAAIRRADTVVLETVEREVNYRASDLGLLIPSFFAQLRRALPPQRE